MGLFSFFRKNKQKDSSARETGYVSRSATDTLRQRGQRNTAKNEAKAPDVPENRRARRRLVGAVVLVLAVVVIVPRIFDSKPNPHQDISLQIPDQAKSDQVINVPANPQQPINNDNVTVDNDSEEEVVTPSASAQASAPAVPSPAVPVQPATPVAPPVQNTVPPAPVKPAAPAAPVVKAPEPVAKPKPAPKPAPAAPAPNKAKDDAAETARALAILDGKAPAKTAEKSSASDTRKFIVQVAALSDPAKVAALRQKLSSAGISSFTQQVKTASGETTRIRVGPFNGRDAAESMRTKVNRLGFNASVMPA